MHENTKFSLSHILDAYFKVREYTNSTVVEAKLRTNTAVSANLE